MRACVYVCVCVCVYMHACMHACVCICGYVCVLQGCVCGGCRDVCAILNNYIISTDNLKITVKSSQSKASVFLPIIISSNIKW